MLCSKFQLSARMKRKNLALDEKIKIIAYANNNPKKGMSSDWGTIQDWEDLCLKYPKECKNSSNRIWIFQRKLKKIGQCHLINEILIAWYKKCVSANLFS